MEDKRVIDSKRWRTEVRTWDDRSRYGSITQRKATEFLLQKWSDGCYSLTVMTRVGGVIRDSRRWGHSDAVRFCGDLGVELI